MYLLPNADHMLEAFDDESEENAGALCEEVYVKEEQIDLLSHDCCNVISMWLNGAEVTFSINRNQLTSKALLPVLLRKGFTMLDDPENIKAVLSYVLDSCKGAPKSYVHRRLGFCEVNSSEGNGKTVFLTNGVIGLPDTDEKSKSKYSGEENVVPCGTLESWKAIVEKEVLGHSNMELALAIGVSAPMTFFTGNARRMASLTWDSHIPHIMPSILTVILFIVPLSFPTLKFIPHFSALRSAVFV